MWKNKACVYFCDKRFYRGIMIKGTVEVLEDKESKEMIWQFGDTMYYKKGYIGNCIWLLVDSS